MRHIHCTDLQAQIWTEQDTGCLRNEERILKRNSDRKKTQPERGSVLRHFQLCKLQEKQREKEEERERKRERERDEQRQRERHRERER